MLYLAYFVLLFAFEGLLFLLTNGIVENWAVLNGGIALFGFVVWAILYIVRNQP